ncbi:MAG: Uma2 family endonuclease [Gemmatimonadota bacterium]|nr:Uma2 family endonuclease [Gemmatimonadota bacterium]MDH5283921.1 Uma2 family endonuclease [Gemmatimonadota bacterium]
MEAPFSRIIGDAELPPLTPSPHIMGMPLSVPRYSVDDLDHFPDDGWKYELVDGVLLMTPGPGVPHEFVVERLYRALATELSPDAGARIFTRGSVQFGKFTRMEPDLLVIPGHYTPKSFWDDMRDWWLAVEVLSPSGRAYDMEIKRPAYLALGVAEVWLVDTVALAVQVWKSGAEIPETVTETLRWRPPGMDRDLVIDLAEVFQDFTDFDEPSPPTPPA